MRDFLVLALVYGTLPLIPFRPFLGLCVYSWLAFMRPHDLAWSIGSHRLAMMVMVATGLGVLLHVLFPRTLGRERMARFNTTALLLFALGIWVAITAQTAVDPSLTRNGVWDYFDLEKTLFVAILTTGLVSNFLRFRILVGVTAMSLGLLGLKYGLFGLLRGGIQIVEGPGGFMFDRNAFALALNMAIPLLMAVGTSERSRAVRYLALGLIPATALAIIFCFSRGGYLTLAMVVCAIILRSGKPMLAALILIAGIGAFTFATGETFRSAAFARTNSISEFQEDESASGRIEEWKTALRIFKDYPTYGIGPHNLRAVHSQYSDFNYYKVTHNSFLQLLVDSGWPALTLFLCLLFNALWRLERIRRMPGTSKEAVGFAANLQISIAAFFLGGSLLNLAYSDLIYHLLALTTTLEYVSSSSATVRPELKLLTPVASHWWKQNAA